MPGGMANLRELTNAAQANLNTPWYLIDPGKSSWLGYWDIANGIVLMYIALSAPFEVAFLDPPSSALHPRFIVNRIIDAFFCVDMLLQFFIMYPHEHIINVHSRETLLAMLGERTFGTKVKNDGLEMVHSPYAIAKHYIKGWFVIDFLSVLTIVFDLLPFTLADTSVDSSADQAETARQLDYVRLLRMLRVLRLIKMVRLLKTSRLLKRWETAVALDFSTQTLLRCGTFYLLSAHWFACILVLTTSFADSPLYSWLGTKGYCVRLSERPDGYLRQGATWELQPTPILASLQFLDDVYCVAPFELWVASYFWMMMLISGAAGAGTDQENLYLREQLVFTALVVTSALLWSQIVAQMCGVLANMNPEERAFHQRMDNLNRYCRIHGIDWFTRRSLREYLSRAKAVQVAESHKDLLLVMSPKLRGDLSLQVNGRWLAALPFMKGVEVEILVRTALSLHGMVYVPSELLDSDCIYYVVRGTVVHSGSIIVGGMVFGGDCVVARPELRSPGARALTHVEVSYIQREELMALFGAMREGTDRHGNPAPLPVYPRALNRLRWHAIRLAIVRSIMGGFNRPSGDGMFASMSISQWHNSLQRSAELEILPDAPDRTLSGSGEPLPPTRHVNGGDHDAKGGFQLWA